MNYPENHNDLEEEKSWIEAAKMETSAFEPLYAKYYDEIYRFIYRRTGREVLSDEICSETFYKALANIKKYRWQEVPFGNWLYTIAANELRKRYRHKKEVFIVEIDKIQEQVPQEEVIDRSSNETLIWVLNQLSDIELRLIELKYFEKKTFKSVGQIMNMKESAVKMRIYRILLMMRELIISRHDQV